MRTSAISRTSGLRAGIQYEVHAVDADDLRPGDMVRCRFQGMLQTARFVRHARSGGRRLLVVAPEGTRSETHVPVSDLRGILIVARQPPVAPRARRALRWFGRRAY